jgi:4-amino-4-deoxy-L-arabinose transferase-like glycosyltransferase
MMTTATADAQPTNTTTEEPEAPKQKKDSIWHRAWSKKDKLTWIISFIVGILFEFSGRLLGELIPSSSTVSWSTNAPQLVSICSIFVALYGYFRYTNGRQAGDLHKARAGAMLIILGICMVGASFMSEMFLKMAFGH